MRSWGAEVEAALERDDPLELADLVFDLALEGSDRELVESCCGRLVRHRNAMVRGNAVVGLGHLARRFGRLDENRFKRMVENALHDPSEQVREQARGAADDLLTFLGWEFEVPMD